MFYVNLCRQKYARLLNYSYWWTAARIENLILDELNYFALYLYIFE